MVVRRSRTPFCFSTVQFFLTLLNYFLSPEDYLLKNRSDTGNAEEINKEV